MFDLAARRLYLCVGVRNDMADVPAGRAREGASTSSNCAKKSSVPRSSSRRLAIMAPICREFGVPFVMNDSPELAVDADADGVHVGQDDVSVAHCREVLG